MTGPVPSHQARPWLSLLALAVGGLVLAVGYHAALLLAYQLAEGAAAAAVDANGASYMADDLHSVTRRTLAAILVAPIVWSLVHYYGLRGPLTALAFAVATSVVGYETFARNSGPLSHAAQYLAFAGPAIVALMLAWRVAYRRYFPPMAKVYDFKATARGH